MTNDMWWQHGIGTTMNRPQGLPDPLPPFKRSRCPKCSCDIPPHAKYQTATLMRVDNPAEVRDWIEWTCQECGYMHVTATYDASPP